MKSSSGTCIICSTSITNFYVHVSGLQHTTFYHTTRTCTYTTILLYTTTILHMLLTEPSVLRSILSAALCLIVLIFWLHSLYDYSNWSAADIPNCTCWYWSQRRANSPTPMWGQQQERSSAVDQGRVCSRLVASNRYWNGHPHFKFFSSCPLTIVRYTTVSLW